MAGHITSAHSSGDILYVHAEFPGAEMTYHRSRAIDMTDVLLATFPAQLLARELEIAMAREDSTNVD